MQEIIEIIREIKKRVKNQGIFYFLIFFFEFYQLFELKIQEIIKIIKKNENNQGLYFLIFWIFLIKNKGNN